ncbi:hypothetical protein F53441_7722 [Fusarium austroafricanum]|uniref:Protein kinase domain-containing protein n=1 Tax=Fusarium austroafricanum TaxID=2364996 RepID=A0A8H4NXB1_9HYPO|nr:hypothetical protein F53441_7722 [Fusarium austroafricanum]
MEKQKPPQKITYAAITRSLTNGEILGATDEEQVEWKRAHCEPFMSRVAIRSCVQQVPVKATLRKILDDDRDIDKVTEFVVEKAPIAFLNITFVGAARDENGEPSIKVLQKHGFSDESFPIRTIPKKDIDAEGDPYDICGANSDAILGCFSEWDPIRKFEYAKQQWTFLAPVFVESEFEYKFKPLCRMPFVCIPDGAVLRGAFGTVRQLGLHIDHQDLTSFNLKLRSDKQSTEVAVKFMDINSTGSASDVEKFYAKEGTTLRQMRDMNDPHLIRAIAAYSKGHDRCFIFPWAEGGNLDNFWRTDQSKLDQSLVIWAIKQMTGLSGGIWKLHEKNTRHGDIKPANILYFMDSMDRNDRGTLKIADVGLAKVHEEYTKYRIAASTNRHSSERYEPPEMPGYIRGDPIPRVYDVWSLGCVFLEFTVWLIFGWDRLLEFRQDLVASNTGKFWEAVGKATPRHHMVNKIITDVEQTVPARSALADLIKLISKDLLVPKVDRADAKKIVEKLRHIQEKCGKDRSYCFGHALVAVAQQRPGPASGIPDSLPDNTASSTSVDFLSTNMDLERSLDDLEHSSSDCRMCRFLFRIFSKSLMNPTQTLKLVTDSESYSLSFSSGDPPLISLYLEPDYMGQSPFHAQFGLPILPAAGSSQQFRLLNQWIHLCDTTHECISKQPGTDGIMPTRLIDVGTAQSPSLRLIETKEENTTGAYIALSHCWGRLTREERFCTYIDNLKSLKESIPFDKLPKTFRDAVTVTRGLNTRYLWIDSLCIIQEDREDWKLESARMEDVFNSAYCTIAASSSTSSLDGFLGDREERAVIGIQTPKGPIYLAETIDNFQKHVEQGILNTRGWVFQERALSRRTIHFTSTQVYWECGQGIHCETLAQLRNRESALLGDSNFPTYGLQKYKDDSIRLVEYLYRTYSRLGLTNTTDRSKAILGLQKRLGRTFQSTAEYGVLSAYFERLLLWQVESPQKRIMYPEAERVPSWSWMAFMGRIHYMDIPFGKVAWTGNVKKPFGDVAWEGRMQADAHELLISRADLEERAQADLSDMQLDPVGLRCVVVGTSKVDNQDGTVDQYVLLIRQISSHAASYERVGAGIILDIHVGQGCATVDLV